MEMNLNNSWVYEELNKPENNTYLTDELIGRILALPHDALRQDLEQIIRYHISLGCDDIPDEYDNDTFPDFVDFCQLKFCILIIN